MELRHLRYFVRVAETLSFRAAAKALGVSAPALSRQIRDLEEELGARLFERDTQSVRMTNPGRVFLPEARQILAQVARASEFARDAARGARGRLRIGTIGRRLSPFLPQCLADFGRRFPQVEIALVEADYAEQAGALKSGGLDIGFMPAHALPPLDASFQRERVLSTPIFALLGRSHPLARRRSVSLLELAQEKLLFLGKNKASMSADYATRLLGARGIGPNEIVEVKGFQILLAMVAARQGVSLMGFESNLPGKPGVVFRPLKDRGADLNLEFCAIHPLYGKEPNPLASHFLTALRKLAANRA